MKKLFATLLLPALACSAQAATITVNSTADALTDGVNCTLRGAVAAINGGNDDNSCTATGSGYGTADTIVFDPVVFPPATPQTINLTSAPVNGISISKALTINAQGNDITLDGNDTKRIFNITGGISVTIIGMTFTRGYTSASGGAVVVGSGSTVTIHNSTFRNNKADVSGGAVRTAIGATAIINNSTFSGNTADFVSSGGGGAVWADRSNISNSTFSGNRAAHNGGAVYSYTSTTISNSTFSGNRAAHNGGAVAATILGAQHLTFLNNTADDTAGGQAVHIFYNDATLHNSILIGSNGNDQCTIAPDQPSSPHSIGTITGSHNLEGWATGGTWQAAGTTCGTPITDPRLVDGTTSLGDIIATALADNGSVLTQTLALPTGSPAIGAADTTGTSQMWDFTASDWTDATEDQRGVSRHSEADGRDLGAYEDPDLLRVSVSPFPLPDGTVGTAYNAAHNVTFSGTAGSGSGYTITLADLPPGLSQSGDQLVGTPTAAGNFIISVTVEDGAGATFTRYLPLTIRALSTGSTPIPVLPAPLLLGLAAALGLLGRKRLTQRA